MKSSSSQFEPLVIRHGSLFSGIGGFDLAAQWTGWENVFQVEIDDYCTKVLEKNFPNAKRYRDIREFDGTQYRGTIDVVSGGFPCQPFSVAGKRKGKEDDRYLWPEMLRVISEIKPTWIVGENVAGIIKMELGNVLDGVEALGYETQAFLIPAASVDAKHKRDRVWIVANYTGDRRNDSRTLEQGRQSNMVEVGQTEENKQKRKKRIGELGETCKVDTNTECTSKRSAQRTTDNKYANHKQHHRNQVGNDSGNICRWSIEPDVGRVVNGVPHRMDRVKGLGNAIVPQVAFEIFRAIAAVSV